MPRLQPPPGYITAADAAERLGVSQALLSRYVNEGKISRYGPPERKHKFYKLSEIEGLLQSSRIFKGEYQRGQWRDNASSTYALATVEDMPALGQLGAKALGYSLSPDTTRIARLQKNPECYQIVRNQAGTIVGYVSILPLTNETVARLIRDEIKTADLAAEEIQLFEPGRPLHMYILAMCVDSDYQHAERRGYGARLILGMMTFLFDLAGRGVEIEAITARSWTGDGIRLLRHMNIPQLRSPVPGKNLFSVRVAESGIPLLMRYSEMLDEWKQQHTPTFSPVKRPRTPQYQTIPSGTLKPVTLRAILPTGWAAWTPFIQRHGIDVDRHPIKALNRQEYCVEGEYMQVHARGQSLVKCALNEDGQRRLLVRLRSTELIAQELKVCEVEACPCHEVLSQNAQ